MTDFADKQTAKIDNFINEIATATDEAKKSQAFAEWVKFQNMLHDYSWSNQLLIMWQKPYGTRAMALSKWEKLGGHKKEGATPAYILAPITFKDEDTDETRFTGKFRGTVTFVQEDIEGATVPEIDWKQSARQLEIEAKLTKFAESNGIKVDRNFQHTSAQGVSMGGAISVLPNAATKTLIHEIAHELMHRGTEEDRKAKELEAETVAFVVGAFFGLADVSKSGMYVAVWGGSASEIKKRMTKIASVAKTIINSVVKEA